MLPNPSAYWAGGKGGIVEFLVHYLRLEKLMRFWVVSERGVEQRRTIKQVALEDVHILGWLGIHAWIEES